MSIISLPQGIPAKFVGDTTYIDFGVAGSTPDVINPKFNGRNTFTIDVVSITPGASALVTFDKGQGFNNEKPVGADSSESFFEPGTRTVRVSAVGGDISVIVIASTNNPR